MKFLKTLLLSILLLFSSLEAAKLPNIDEKKVGDKIQEIMQAHASYKSIDKEVVKRALSAYVEELDPSKTYFLAADVKSFTQPTDQFIDQTLANYKKNNYSAFFNMHETMIAAIERRDRLEKEIKSMTPPKKVNPKEFKDLPWAKDEAELKDRLLKIMALRLEAAEKLGEDKKELAIQRIEKRRLKYEEDFRDANPKNKKQFILANVLKSTAQALDSHTVYFTPGEATQFMINVQQRLFGIGAQLRDDLTGFSIVKIIEGGPAAREGLLKNKDRIIAISGEPVVGMEITDVVELIRGEAGTIVALTVVRDDENGLEQNVDVNVTRGEVVLTESRYESTFEPFGDGVIAYVKLYSFYQDPESFSAKDIKNELEKLKKEHNLKGVVLDLRYNSGGMLSQAVAVTGLFITKGVVVSIKDSNGQLQHLRDTDSAMVWDGPLIVLTNRASASASEIVTQTLQDYGRAIIVGDETTFGKGSFQTFTLNGTTEGSVNPEGEYKVTRGRYYTVSGKSPQLEGVKADVVVPGALSKMELGERFQKFPLSGDQIEPKFDDDLADIPANQRFGIAQLYQFNLQKKEATYTAHLDFLRKNSKARIDKDKNYQVFLKELDELEKDAEESDAEEVEAFGKNDLQLVETYNIMKDLILLQLQQQQKKAQPKIAA